MERPTRGHGETQRHATSPGGASCVGEVQMSAITVPETEPETQVIEAAATITASKMFRYSEYVDVGDGAVACEHSRDGECVDPEHFHAWCRLPNPYQHADIRAKGMAAKARRIRALKDPETDEATVLNQSLASLDDPAFTSVLIDELVSRDWAQDYLDAMAVVSDREEFEHLEQDREEHSRLAALQGDRPEDEQSPEFKALNTHLEAHAAAMKAALAEIQDPKRAELASHSHHQVLALARDARVESEADREFMDTYNAWTCFVGTFHVKRHETLGRPYLPMWDQIGQRDRPAAGTMFSEAPEVIAALAAVYQELQLSLQRGSSGN